MIRKILQIRNLLMALLVGECGILFGLYLLLNTPILLAFSVYALIKNVIIFLIVVYISYVLENNQLMAEYTVVLYGDVNGDGKINSIDLLVLQRDILEIEKLSGVFLQAGNVRKNGREPSSVDSLKIQRHILGLELTAQ